MMAKQNTGDAVILTAEDCTPSGGLSQSSMDKIAYRDYMKAKRKLDGVKKSFPKKRTKLAKSDDIYPDVVPISDTRLARHDTGAGDIEPTAMRSSFHQKKFENKKQQYVKRIELAARAEILNKEESGFLEAEDGELTYTIRQREIANAVDLASASKQFELHLPQFGPYHLDYTDNGRYLLLGGKKGHLASFDWQNKKLQAESNVMEVVRDVKWLHTENMYAVAQNHYTYVYDNTGTELHCVKEMGDVRQLEFLPRHFLLVGGSRNSWLHFLDVSVGKMVVSFCTKSGPLDVVSQNPANAIIFTGHGNGTVSLWSPNVREPLVKMLVSPGAIKGLTVDSTGRYMITNGLDNKCRIWDVRMYRQLHAYGMPYGLSSVAVSEKMTVACAVGNTVQVFNDMHVGSCKEPYITHRCPGNITDMKFVPYEDVLGIGHMGGFTSMLVPGCGEANVDAVRSNPYETKSQRREREVRQLLDKLQPDLICLDPTEITRVNEDLLERAEEDRKKLLYLRPVQVQYTPKHKMRGRGSGHHKEVRKQAVTSSIVIDRSKAKEAAEREFLGRGGSDPIDKPKHVLDRFRS